LAQDFVAHFEQRQAVFEGKVMFVAMSRGVLVRLYDQIVALRPDWAQQGKIKVIMTASSDDPEEFQPHFTTSQQRKDLAIAFKNPKDPFQIALVCDMWLTGFDAPCLHTLYLDKKMHGAALMQAIARVNRVYKDKP
jgi:type I site-specific deoxyribonuclease, hsdR family